MTEFRVPLQLAHYQTAKPPLSVVALPQISILPPPPLLFSRLTRPLHSAALNRRLGCFGTMTLSALTQEHADPSKTLVPSRLLVSENHPPRTTTSDLLNRLPTLISAKLPRHHLEYLPYS